MIEKRKFQRFPVELQASLINTAENTSCMVTDVSRSGMAITLSAGSRFSPGEKVRLKIMVPTEEQPVVSEITLAWAQRISLESGFVYTAGGPMTDISAADKWSLLDYAFDYWKRAQHEAYESLH